MKEWYGQLGIDVSVAEPTTATRSANLVLPPEPATARPNYDIELWGWGGNPDPNGLLDRSSAATQIGSLSDSQYCNPEYDELYDQQLDAGRRRSATTTLAQMQNLIYDQAPYDILYYDANLDVYRNDKFAGWQNMPADGHAVLHLRHPQLHAADGRDGRSRRRRRRRRPAVGPGGPRGAGRAGAPAPGRDRRSDSATSGAGSNTTLLLVLVAVIAVVVVRRARLVPAPTSADVEDE